MKKIITSLGNILTEIRDFFARSWAYLKSSNATFSSLGNDLITSAQTDLINLKGQLDKLWVIKEEDKRTAALYLAAVLGKFGFTFIIIGVSAIASLLKLTGGACCLLLAGKWFTLVSKIFNIFRETLVQSLTMLRSFLGKFVTNALELCNKIAKNLGKYIKRFLDATLDFLQAVTSYLSSAWQKVLDFVAAAVRGFVRVAKWIGNQLLNAWRLVLDFAAAVRHAIWQGIKAIGRFAKNFMRNLICAVVNCFNGVCHLALGAIKATAIVTKGIVLSVTAIFFETGIASSLSGVAKTMFILDEYLAAGIGALMDGVYAGGSSFIKAAKSLFGYGVTTPEPIARAQSAFGYDEAGMESEAWDEVPDHTYFSRKAYNGMHYVNECVASAGKGIFRVYEEQKSRMNNPAECSIDSEYVRSSHQRQGRVLRST